MRGDRHRHSRRGRAFAALPPLALYIHIPWCIRKCPYCDFNSHEARGDVPEAQYVDALLADLEFALPSIWGRRIVSIFIGGGTPSLFSAAAIDRLLAGVRARVPLTPDAEVTLEANPGTFERQKFAGFPVGRREPAVARRAELRPRTSSRRWAACTTSTRRARGRGGARDLRQREPRPHVRAAASRRWPRRTADAAAAIAFAPPHLSFYQLTLEPNTLFHRHPPPLPDPDAAADIEDAVARAARGGGLPALRDFRVRATGPRMPAQSQLLAVRRLPRHRRRRAFEAVVPRSRRAAGALEAAEAVSRARRCGRAVDGECRR